MTIDPTQFVVHPSSGVPIYRQIIDQVEAMIVGARLREGEMLPSVREMATALGVNPMTISKAYARLETDNVVERVRGKGMMVRRRSPSGSKSQRLEELRPTMRAAVVRSRQLGLTDDQILELVRQILREIPS
ncbi:GntR family transcriptional regulator [Blastopirellula sp. J2-11]|uniref:GntR family transcriptional regulator n=1 Tax=Blastopirellula sp. J2-11 TaxID=2943192 RepID=UPI0021C69313|nr:GntR family transcriptional regulator [Blastopirellula sp. J2-11]UUO08790.1 GntR family transcriptional regulator [Blastopirellula sp. J2-11]